MSILPVTPSFTDAPKGWVPLDAAGSEVPVRRLIFGSQGRVEQPTNPQYLLFYIGSPEDFQAAALDESMSLPWIEVGPRTGVPTFHQPSAGAINSP